MSTDRNGHDSDGPVEPFDDLEAQVDDPEEYVTRRRLRDIFDARRDLRETRREAAYKGNADARRAYRSDVSSYIAEVEPLLRQHEVGEELWSDTHFGTVTLSPEIEHSAGGTPRVVISRDKWGSAQTATLADEPVGGLELEVEGLQSIFDLPDPLQDTMQVVTEGRYGTEEVRTVPATGTLSFGVIDGMARATHNFLAEIGLEVDINEQDDEWEIGTR